MTALGEYPLKYIGCGSGSLMDPYGEVAPDLRICGTGIFPRHLHLRVDRQPWTLLLQEDRKEAEPSLRERWLHHCQTVAPVLLPDFIASIALGGTSDYEPSQHSHQHNIMNSMGTGMAINPGLVAWANHLGLDAPPPYPPYTSPAPAPPPPKIIPKPDIFKLGKQPRRIEGGP